MMIHRAALRQRERERKSLEKPVEETKAPVKEQVAKPAPAPKRGKKSKR